MEEEIRKCYIYLISCVFLISNCSTVLFNELDLSMLESIANGGMMFFTDQFFGNNGINTSVLKYCKILQPGTFPFVASGPMGDASQKRPLEDGGKLLLCFNLEEMFNFYFRLNCSFPISFSVLQYFYVSLF